MDRVFEVLSHRIRRAIIESIAERGPRSFTQLMDDADVKDTGTLTFHLRKMAGFLRKNERGDYELTELGWKAYSVLKNLKGAGETKPAERVEVKREAVQESLEPQVVVLGDRIKVVINRSLLEHVKSRGKRLVVMDAVAVDIADDVDPKLFDEVVESIVDVVTVRAPESLKGLIELKCRDVASIHVGRGGPSMLPGLGFIGDIVGSIVSTVSSIVESIVEPLASLGEVVSEAASRDRRLVYSESFTGVRGLSVDITGGYFKAVTARGGEARISVYESLRDGKCRYNVDLRDGILMVDASGCIVEVSIPEVELDVVEASVSGGYTALSLTRGAKRVSCVLSGGLLEVDLGNMAASTVELSVSGGKMRVNLSYRVYEGSSRVNLDLAGGLLEAEMKVPKGVRVDYKVDRIGGWATVSVDRELQEIEKAVGRLEVDISVTGGLARVGIKRAESS